MIFTFLFAGVLGGCALSPQDITLQPEVKVPESAVALSGPVAVTVYDERLSPWLGTRGGVYSGSNRIGIENSIQQAIKTEVERALQSLGMDPVNSADAPQFQIYVDALKYQVPKGNLVTSVDLNARLRLRVVGKTGSYQGQYTATDTRRVLKAPSDADNQAMVNGIVSKAIEAMLADPGLMRFLVRQR